MTRHSLDFTTKGSKTVSDASRTAVYLGTVTVSGGVNGEFSLDVHNRTSGGLEWTCGRINNDETGRGPCY